MRYTELLEAEPIKAWHGTTAKFDVPDLRYSGTGATADGAFAAHADLPKALYLHSDKAHAEYYGDPVLFEITGKLKRVDAAAELEKWATEEEGHKSAQDMINAYGGDLYTAMNLDDYLLDQLEAAQAEGYGGVAVDFGNLKDKHADNHWRPAGTFYVVSMLRKAL